MGNAARAEHGAMRGNKADVRFKVLLGVNIEGVPFPKSNYQTWNQVAA
jgi:hypothetical protein